MPARRRGRRDSRIQIVDAAPEAFLRAGQAARISAVAVLFAVLLAVFVLPSPWGLVAILTGAVIELGEAWFWIRFTRRRSSVTGAEGLIGRRARVVQACRPDGKVRVHGELWNAHCAAWADAGAHVHVVRVEDLTLVVE
jgi:membrane protein implicated in regulation of membrane protease activity